MFEAHQRDRKEKNHNLEKPRDPVRNHGIDMQVLPVGGKESKAAIEVTGGPNPDCANTKLPDANTTKSALYVGVHITFGKFRIVDLGELTWNKELDPVCLSQQFGRIGRSLYHIASWNKCLRVACDSSRIQVTRISHK